MEILLKTTLLVFGLLLAVLHSQASTTVPSSQNQDDNGAIDIDETHDYLRDVSSDGSGDSETDEEEESSGNYSNVDEVTGSGITDQSVTAVNYVPQIKILTDCQKRYQQSIKHGKHVLQCTSTGEYEKVQCKESVCWCVSPNGKLIQGTKQKNIKPDCRNGTNLSPCLWELVKHHSGLLGSFRPNCSESGEYEQVQCQGSKCWCSDKDGKEITGSEVQLPNKPVCDVLVRSEITTLKKSLIPKVMTSPKTTTTEAIIEKGLLPKNPETEPKLSTPRISILSISTSSGEMSSAPFDDRIHEHKPNESATEEPGIMAAIIAGAVVGLFVCILLTMFIVYRMRKKDEGSYPLDEPTKSNYSYTKAPDKEFYA